MTQLELHHFRGIQNLTLSLEEPLTIIIGPNGAGKSTILEALAILLSWLVARLRHAGASGRSLQELDIYNRAPFAMLKAKAQTGQTWQLVKARKGFPKPNVNSELQMISSYAKTLQEQLISSQQNGSIPLFAYYPVNRAVLDIPLRIRQTHAFTLLEAYEEALTSGANFRQFFEWFRHREDLENETRRDQATDFTDKQLTTVRKALKEFLPDFENLRVKRNPLRMIAMKHGSEIRIDQLSDSEKCLMAMIGDLARRLAIANPTLDDPLTGEGVVLIDGIELHLHLAWQRNFITKLIHVFSHCQFVLSTHSPQVLGEVHGSCIRILHREETGERFNVIPRYTPKQVLGLDSAEILEELMGSSRRDKQTDKELNDIFVLIDQGRFTEAKTTIALLKEKLNGGIPEMVRAEGLIAMLESDIEGDNEA